MRTFKTKEIRAFLSRTQSSDGMLKTQALFSVSSWMSGSSNLHPCTELLISTWSVLCQRLLLIIVVICSSVNIICSSTITAFLHRAPAAMHGLCCFPAGSRLHPHLGRMRLGEVCTGVALSGAGQWPRLHFRPASERPDSALTVALDPAGVFMWSCEGEKKQQKYKWHYLYRKQSVFHVTSIPKQ